jgi:sialate O-acetylesterase
MAVTTDIGNVVDIHPANKQDVGKRLALWALARHYGKSDLVYSGPLYESMSVEGNKIRVRFGHVGGGLIARGDKPLSHFLIAGEDQQFFEAMAVIDGGSILVSSDKVSKPVAVRFAWEQTAEPNLFNKEGLPASPFRTDDFKLISADAK